MRLHVLAWFLIFGVGSSAAESPEIEMSRGHELIYLRLFEEGRRAYREAQKSEEPFVRSVAQLAIAQSYVIEHELERAREEFAKVGADAPEHHRWEAARRAEELKRQIAGLPPREVTATRTKLPPLPGSGLTVTVASNARIEGSFRTLEGARDHIRLLRKAGILSRGRINVLVHGGEYIVTNTFTLTAEDSGTAESPVVYRAVAGENPVFRGGVRLSGFEVAKGATNLPEQSRGKVLQASLPDGMKVLPLVLGGFGSGRGFRTHPAHELFFNGKALQMARGPNEGFLKIGDVAVKDGTTGYDRWGSKVGTVLAAQELPRNWRNETDLLLYGYWFWDWADSYERVASVEGRQITLDKPYHTYGYSVGAPFYAVHALSELDLPGEWYLDRKNRKVLFYPPEAINNAVVELSVFDQRMVHLNNVAHVRFEGLTWELGSADAIHVEGGSNCWFVGCTVRRFAGNGIEVNGGKQHGIISCDIYSMGRGGTWLIGGDRKTLDPGGHVLENCEIYDLSRIDHTYTPAVVLGGVSNRVAHNRFHNILSSAMRVGGNDHIIEYNEVFETVLESDDQGGADMYGNATYRGNIFRFNSWRQIGGSDPAKPKTGKAGIRLDDAISGTLVYGNIFERASAGFGAVQIHGGKDNIIDNNLFIACKTAVSFTPWNETRWTNFVKNALEAKDVGRDLYLKRYPALKSLEASANENHVWRNRTVLVDQFVAHPHRRLVRFDNVPLERCNPVEEVPGFTSIPHQEIGLYADQYRKR